MGVVVPLGRWMIISGVLGALAILAIPVGAAAPGSVLGEAASVIWLLSLVPVAVGVRRVVGSHAGSAALLAFIGGTAGIVVQANLSLAVVLGLASPLQYAPISAAAYAVTGAWLIAANGMLMSARILAPAPGWFGAGAGMMQVASYVLLLVGGFPTSIDPAALASFHPATILASVLGLLSLPVYAVWAIWSGRRLSVPAGVALTSS